MKVYSVHFDWYMFQDYKGTYSSEDEALECIKNHPDYIEYSFWRDDLGDSIKELPLIHTCSIEDRHLHDDDYDKPYFWIHVSEVGDGK